MSGTNAPMRIGLLGLYHEANSFAPTLVNDAYIEAAGIFRGEALLREFRGSESTAGGFIAAAEADAGVELVPLVLTTLTPAGPLTRESLDSQSAEFRMALRSGAPFHGLLVVLHGAAVAETIDDVDGYLLQLIRGEVGSDVVIGASLDLHANISEVMCATADVLNTYRTNPHVDARIRAEEVAHVVFAAARREVLPTTAFVPIPAFVNILRQNTNVSPMAEILDEVRAASHISGVLSVSVAEGYPYADVPEMGMSVVVVTDDDRQLAHEIAVDLANKTWARRESFEVKVPGAREALKAAAVATSTPVLLLDVGDNIGGGAPGDSVVLLEEAIALDVRDLVTIVVDEYAASACHQAGIGSRLDLRIGAHSAGSVTSPVRTRATVAGLSDGRFEATETLHAGFRHFDAGISAAVVLDSGQTVVLTSRATMPLTPVQLEDVGLSLDHYRAIVAKGVHSPLAGYGPRVAEVVQVDTPGVTSADCSLFNYRKRRRPLFPLEREAQF